MLAAIIANLQNVQPQRLPTVQVDRGGGGPSWPRYEIVDIIAAISSFREIPGEHPVARAVRRHRHIGEALPGIREAREAREGAAFLAGAQVAAAAIAAEEAEAPRPIIGEAEIAEVIRLVDEARASAIASRAPLPATECARGAYSMRGGGGIAAVGLVAIGVVIGLAIARRRRSRFELT